MVEIKHILYATDNSENALQAYQYASSLARQYAARLTLLHVIQESFDLSVFDINMGRSSSEKKWLEARRQYLQKRRKDSEHDIEQQFSKENISADRIIIESGVPSKVILIVAEQERCDFIVMGMRGKGSALEEAIMGDTLRRVLHRSRLPVLVVEPFEQGS